MQEHDELGARIDALTDRQVNAALQALVDGMRHRAEAMRADGAEVFAILAGPLAGTEAEAALREALPGLPERIDGRTLLRGLAGEAEHAEAVREAVEHSQFASATLGLIAVATVVTLLLSVQFDLSVTRRNGKLDVSFQASKKPTALGFIGRILRLPALGGVLDTAGEEAEPAAPKRPRKAVASGPKAGAKRALAKTR